MHRMAKGCCQRVSRAQLLSPFGAPSNVYRWLPRRRRGARRQSVDRVHRSRVSSHPGCDGPVHQLLTLELRLVDEFRRDDTNRVVSVATRNVDLRIVDGKDDGCPKCRRYVVG